MRKSIKYLVIALATILLFTIGCNSQTQELSAYYLIGKWINHHGTISEDGVTSTDPISSGKRDYNFYENGTVETGLDGNLTWAISKDNELLLSEDGQTATYKVEIESDTSFILKRTFKKRTFKYYFKKGEEENFKAKAIDSVENENPELHLERNYKVQEIGKRILYTGGSGLRKDPNTPAVANGIYITKLSESQIEYEFSKLLDWKLKEELNGTAVLHKEKDYKIKMRNDALEPAYKFVDIENGLVIYITKNTRIGKTNARVFDMEGNPKSVLMYFK